MEHLFSTSISIHGQSIRYEVNFLNEHYIFQPASGENESDSFSLKREHDEWIGEGKLTPEITPQAIELLEKYLMKQH
jgi:hypothetical protein